MNRVQHVEIGIGGEQISWREHVFSKKISKSGDLSFLAWEPIFDESDEKIFSVTPDVEIKWEWRDWEYAKKTLHCGKVIISETITKHPENPFVRFNENTQADDLEIILFGEQKTAAIRQQMPENIYREGIKFKKKGKTFLISVNGNLSIDNLVVEKYDQERLEKNGSDDEANYKYYFTYRGVLNFDRQPYITIQKSPPVYLAVVKRIGNSRKMLAGTATGIVGGEMNFIDLGKKEQADLQLIIENASKRKKNDYTQNQRWEEWLNNWSQISQEKFLQLAQTASTELKIPEKEAQRLAQHHATGLHRALVLHVLGCPYIKTGFWPVESLDGKNFLASFAFLKKEVAEILNSVQAIEEKLWVIKEAQNDCLPQAFKNVDGAALPVLQRELHLLEKRRDAVRMREKNRKAV